MQLNLGPSCCEATLLDFTPPCRPSPPTASSPLMLLAHCLDISYLIVALDCILAAVSQQHLGCLALIQQHLLLFQLDNCLLSCLSLSAIPLALMFCQTGSVSPSAQMQASPHRVCSQREWILEGSSGAVSLTGQCWKDMEPFTDVFVG